MPIACAPLEHADTTPNIWPRSPYFIDTAAAPALGVPAADERLVDLDLSGQRLAFGGDHRTAQLVQD